MRTSESHPLRIDWIDSAPTSGRLGMTFCPGKVQEHSLTGSWQRNLHLDMARITQFGTTHLLCLLEPWELDQLQVPNLPAVAKSYGLEYFSMPIKDVNTPSRGWESLWLQVRPTLVEACRTGKLVVFCKGGLGRTGLYAAILLQELGLSALASVEKVRATRDGTIETTQQLEYVMQYQQAKQFFETI